MKPGYFYWTQFSMLRFQKIALEYNLKIKYQNHERIQKFNGY